MMVGKDRMQQFRTIHVQARSDTGRILETDTTSDGDDQAQAQLFKTHHHASRFEEV
jgi:hypothetical protein